MQSCILLVELENSFAMHGPMNVKLNKVFATYDSVIMMGLYLNKTPLYSFTLRDEGFPQISKHVAMNTII